MSSTEDRVKRIVCEQLGVGEEEVTLELLLLTIWELILLTLLN